MAGYRINGQELLVQDAADVLAQRNGANAQTLRVYKTWTDASNYERLRIDGDRVLREFAGTGAAADFRIGTGTGTGHYFYLHVGGSDRWRIDADDGHFKAAADDSNSIGVSAANRPLAIFLAQPSITAGSGTGVTLNDSGSVREVTYKVTVTYTALAAAALTADKVIATLPAKTRLIKIIADTTTKYIGGGATEATLIVGKTTGGNQYVVSHDVFTAAITRGLADADLGTSINRANAIQGGDLPSWTATTNVSVRLTTVTANTDQLTQGSTTYYLVTEKMQ